MTTCFVIMPFGGKEVKRQEYFQTVFDSIIKVAANKAGYDRVIRGDTERVSGNIMQQIVRELAESDLVIADLTEANANVFYELGVRHVLRKNGTVHIIDKSHQIPFDVQPYRAVEYSTEFSAIARSIEDIVQAIRARTKETITSDNPVHDALPSLPVDVRTIGDAQLRNQIEDLQARLDSVSDERDRFFKKLQSIDPYAATDESDDIDLDRIFSEADEQFAVSGESILLRLVNAHESGGPEVFIRELREVLKNPYLVTRANFYQIRRLCKEAGLAPYERATLEVAVKVFPHDTDLTIALADVYEDSPLPDLRARGRLIIEKLLGVEQTATGPRVKGRRDINYASAAMTLFNFYINEKRYDWLYSVADSLEEQFGESGLFSRNKARALHKLRRSDEAREEFKRCIEIDPSNDTTYAFYGDFLDDQGEYTAAYEMFEKAICCDPQDGSRFISLANHIILRGYLRNLQGEIVGSVNLQERHVAAAPLLFRGLQDRYRNQRQMVINLLVEMKFMREAKAIQDGNIPEGNYNTIPLQYVEALIANNLPGLN